MGSRRPDRVLAVGLALLVGLLLAACGAGSAPVPAAGQTTTSPATTPTAPAPRLTHFAASGCPVRDTDFCERAARAANALVTGDVVALMTLAGLEEFDCAQLPAGMVSNCRPGRTLRGVAAFTVETKMTVYPVAIFQQRVADWLARTDTAYTDERGTGEVTVYGVGTCGPDDPQRRSYHLAFAAAQRGDAGAATERWLGSLEFVLRGDVWVFTLMYLDTVAHWRTEYADPFGQAACGNVVSWRSA
jgi:hypothetical protein